MPLYTADALVLRTYKLGEADRIVVFLTADRGKKRGVAKSARRPRSRFVGALEPLTHVRVAYFEKETRELVGMNYAEPVRSPLSAPDPTRLGYASYFAELLDEWAPADDPNETAVPSREPRCWTRWPRACGVDGAGAVLRVLAAAAAGRVSAAPGLSMRRAVQRRRRGGAWLSPLDGVLTCGGCADGLGARMAGAVAGALSFLARAGPAARVISAT